MAREPIEFSELDEITPPRMRAVRSGETGGRRTVSTRDEAPIDFDDDEEEAQFLRTERRVAVRRSAIPRKTEKWVKRGLVLAAALAVTAGLGASAYSYATHSWRFRIASRDNIEIDGVNNASRTLVMEVAGKDIGRNIFSVPMEERKQQLERVPWVESATVMRLLPNRIAVHIQERTPVAFVQLGPKVSLIDANGVVMGLPASKQAKYSFPVIRGMTETEPVSSRAAAMKIYNRLVQELDSSETKYSQQLSEVDLSDPEDVKVTANDAGGAVLIHLGPGNFLDRYKLYVAHIGEWRQQFQNPQSVDLRYEGRIIVSPDNSHAVVPPAAKQLSIKKATVAKRKHHKKKKPNA